MEAERKPSLRPVQRCYQCCRFEEEILALAYEHVYPQLRRTLITREPAEKNSYNERMDRRAWA
jgi:hypothetical protein